MTPSRPLADAGTIDIAKPAAQIGELLLDPAALQGMIPNAILVHQKGAGEYEGELAFSLGRLQGRYIVRLASSSPGRSISLSPERAPAGWAAARLPRRSALVELSADRTRLSWRYEGRVFGPISLVGGPVLRLTSSRFIEHFLAGLARA